MPQIGSPTGDGSAAPSVHEFPVSGFGAACAESPIWNSTHIWKIEIIWDESLALEGRAVYYDGTGALEDMLQNHLLKR